MLAKRIVKDMPPCHDVRAGKVVNSGTAVQFLGCKMKEFLLC
jgi:hypothetical protein